MKYERVARFKGIQCGCCCKATLVSRAPITRFLPQPDKTEALPDGLAAEFPLSGAIRAGRILVTPEAGAPGLLTQRVSVENGPSVEFKQVVLP